MKKCFGYITKGSLMLFIIITSIIMFGGIIPSPACAGTDGSNNSADTALVIVPGQQVTTSIDYKGDQDWYKIIVDHTCSLAATITNNSGFPNYDLYDASLNALYGKRIYSSNIFSWKVSPGVYYIKLSDGLSIDYLNNSITLRVDIREEDQWENNDVSARAKVITPGQQLTGIVMEAENDQDWFKISVDHTCSLVANITNNSGFPYYDLYDASLNALYGKRIYSSNIFSWKVSPGVYYIKLSCSSTTGVDYLKSNLTMKITLVNDYDSLITLGQSLFCFFFGEPVNVSTGNYTFEHTDLNIPTRGIPLQFSRSYNSSDGYNGPLGKGWQHNYNTFLTINGDNSVSVLYPDGHMTLFTYTNGSYTRQSGSSEILTRNLDGTYTLTFKDQSKYIYNAQGKLIQIADKNNNVLNLQYNGSVLSAVYEPAGRALQFAYDQNNRLSQITDPAGRTIAFTYDANSNLSTSRDLNSEITTYTYGNYGLTSIIDPNNHTLVKNTYDTSSRVIEQEDGKGNKTKFTYDPTNKKNTITDPRSNAATFYYDDKYRITKIAYPQNITSLYTYDASYNRTSETDKNGRSTNYTYDGMSNVLTKTDPAPLSYKTTYTYDSFNNPTQVVDAAGYLTNYTYDEKGNPLTVSRAIYGGTATTSFAYNEYGQVTGITNANGKTTQFSYDQYGNQALATDPLDHATSYTYDIVGRKLTKTDALGHTASYTYDAAGNVLTVTDPLGNVTTNIYDPKGNRTSTIDPKGNKTTFTYDQNDKLITTTGPLGKTTTFGYDSENNLISITDANNHTTTNNYDFLNRLISTTDPGGKTETYTLDGNGNKISKTDRNGNTTTFTYDALNRLTKVTDALSNAAVTEYDPLGNKISVTDQRGNITRFTYDQGSRLLSVTDPLNHTTYYTYDLVGNRLSVTDARDAKWTYTYDDANRLITVTDPLGNISKTEYDSVGNAVYRTDANNITTSFGYDPLSRLALVTDALGHTTGYTYDKISNLTAVTNARGQTFTLTYDALNRLTEEKDPLGNANKKTYDPVGNLITRTKPDGSNINYSYDTNNRLTNIIYPDNTGVSYAYDASGNRTSMVDPAGATGYSFDKLNRLTSVTRSVYSVGYDYDPTGNITGITYPDGFRVNYSYNGLNMPVSVSDSVYSTTISYDETGNRLQEVLPNGITVNYCYDPDGRLTDLQHDNGQNIIARSAYILDKAGNRLSVTDELNRTTHYTYDDLYQLTKVDYPDGQPVEYTYDPAGNRNSAGGIPYSYDNANRLMQVGTVPFGYDQNGNLISVGEATYYNYDYENRLIGFTDGTKTIEYNYDGDGNRHGQSVSGSVYDTREYIYDINTGIPRLLVEKDGTGNTNNYIHAGRLFTRIGPEGNVYYHQDGLGSVSVISDVYGQPLNRYTYDAFGSPLSVSESISNPFRFTGEPYDANGLIYLRARYYNSVTGRFLSPDTLFGKLSDPLSQNRYVYCNNNPILYVDPTGHILAICAAPAVPYVAAGAAALGTAAVAATVELAKGVKEAWDRFWAKDEDNNLTDKPGKIANKLGKSTAEVNDAIEKVKQGIKWRSGTNNRNPDVVVDTETGEVYPKTPGGGIGDSIGNIFDYLN